MNHTNANIILTVFKTGLVLPTIFRMELSILVHFEGLVVCNPIYWHADRRLLLGQCWGYAGSTQNACHCHGRQYRLWHWFQSLPRKSHIFCNAFFQRFRVSHFLKSTCVLLQPGLIETTTKNILCLECRYLIYSHWPIE